MKKIIRREKLKDNWEDLALFLCIPFIRVYLYEGKHNMLHTLPQPRMA